jgi:hypothetical protein
MLLVLFYLSYLFYVFIVQKKEIVLDLQKTKF